MSCYLNDQGKFFVTLKGTGEILCYFYEKGKKIVILESSCYFI